MRYLILLRGINTGNLKLFKDDFIAMLSASDFIKITTIQSAGTAVASISDKQTITDCISKLSDLLEHFFKKKISIFYRSAKEIDPIVNQANQLQLQKNLNCNIMFHNDDSLFEKALCAHKDIAYLEGERLIKGKGYFIWIVPKGHTLDEFGKKVLGKKPFKDMLTSRSIRTIKKALSLF